MRNFCFPINLILAALLAAAAVTPAAAQKKPAASGFLFIEQGYTPQDSKETIVDEPVKKKVKRKIQYTGNNGQPYYLDEYNYAPPVKSEQQESNEAYQDYLDSNASYDDEAYDPQYHSRDSAPRKPAGESDRYTRVSGPRKTTGGPAETEDPYANPRRNTGPRGHNSRYYRGYYDERSSRRYERGEWTPILLEPVKVSVWSARTTPKDMIIWLPRLGLDLSGNAYDSDGNSYSYGKTLKVWTLENYIHYGITDKFEAALVPTLRYSPDNTDSSFAITDTPLYVRYMFKDSLSEPAFTGFARLILPTDSADSTTHFVHGYGLQITAPYRPVMVHVNLSYNFVSEINNVDPGNYLEYGANCEYYPLDSRFNLMLELGGTFQGKTEIRGITVADTSSSEFHISPGFGITAGRATRLQFSYTRTLSGANSAIENIFRVSMTSKFPKFSEIFY
ncbi:MAG: hypothetical protein PHW69_02855 [Elusimicrobiaceae bacterium]|nr:hypothetical protein [Elusimicrobiaceae bacterium]